MQDLISRQAAIDAVKRLMCDSELSRTVQTGLHILPSAQPREKGKWIEQDAGCDGVFYECSVCKGAFTLMEGTPSDNNYNFCPNCGSYNGGGEE